MMAALGGVAREINAGLVLDGFQREAIEHLNAGRSVLVSAPTGSGKTLIAQHAIRLALASNRRAVYTAPIKALSNQKYHDFIRWLGVERVGLLTGDNSINENADVVVMTTEVLRNMLYGDGLAGSDALDIVVLDEVHYLGDIDRGSVWEEVILHLPEHVKLVCLSATVSNCQELGDWIECVRYRARGSVAVISEQERPVPLTNLYVVGRRRSHHVHIMDVLLADGEPNSHARAFDVRRRSRGANKPQVWRSPLMTDLLAEMGRRSLLPAIWFIFSRKGCARAVDRLVSCGISFTDSTDAERIDEIVESGLAKLSSTEREVLRVEAWADALRSGVAAHHAGMVPALKEIVERCFIEGLVKVVFATETLALGVNMPARSVVIDALTKYNGTSRVPLTDVQYTQLTGRAGRRGIDDAGYALVPWSPRTRFDVLAKLASSHSFRLQSAFQPSYNMIAGLLHRMPYQQACNTLSLSFAHYQSDPDMFGTSMSSSLTSQFNSMASVMRDRGHLDGWKLTASGELVSLVPHSADLIIAESLANGYLDGLSVPELASVLSAFTYETRQMSMPEKVWIPSKRAYHRLGKISKTLTELNRLERYHNVTLTSKLDEGFAPVAHYWAAGVSLKRLMTDHNVNNSYNVNSLQVGKYVGDFVRNVKQVIDIAYRVAQVAPDRSTASVATKVAESMDRGVVAIASSMEPDFMEPDAVELNLMEPDAINSESSELQPDL